MSEEFTTKDLAHEMLIWFERDIPETVIRSLRLILKNYITTGVYNDQMELLLGQKPVPLLCGQRFGLELTKANERIKELEKQLLSYHTVYYSCPKHMGQAYTMTTSTVLPKRIICPICEKNKPS